jgi:hypothetical protein
MNFIKNNIPVLVIIFCLLGFGLSLGSAQAQDTLVLSSGAACPIHPLGNPSEYDPKWNPKGLDASTCTHPGLELFADLVEKCNPAPVEVYPDLPECGGLVVSPSTGIYPCIDYGE